MLRSLLCVRLSVFKADSPPSPCSTSISFLAGTSGAEAQPWATTGCLMANKPQGSARSCAALPCAHDIVQH